MSKNIINLLNRDWFKKATLEDVEAEIKNGADVNIANKNGWTPLMFAIQNRCDIKIVKALLKAGANINIKDRDGVTPLMLAALCDGADVIDILIENGADIEAMDNDLDTALMYAYNNPMGMKKLIDHGANINVKDFLSDTLFDRVAIRGKKPEVIKILLDLGMNINAKNKDFDDATPLIKAVMCNEHIEMIKTLVEAGADIRVYTTNGRSLLDFAKENKNPEIFQFIERLEKENGR